MGILHTTNKNYPLYGNQAMSTLIYLAGVATREFSLVVAEQTYTGGTN